MPAAAMDLAYHDEGATPYNTLADSHLPLFSPKAVEQVDCLSAKADRLSRFIHSRSGSTTLLNAGFAIHALQTATPTPVDSRSSTFLTMFPQYKRTAAIDELRKKEYGRLDQGRHVYLDYTAGGLYADRQIQQHLDLLKGNLFGNPHSINPPSLASTELVEDTRRAILKFFHANPEDYAVIFTPNASGALKIVGESYPFGPDGRFLLTVDNHNSVNGIREFAKAKGSRVTYVPVRPEDLRVDESVLMAELCGWGRDSQDSTATEHPNQLFAYPAQSNFSGVQHPLEWCSKAKALGWDVLIDAAAFVPTSKLDIDLIQPDYVPLSFYKMFGYPTGIGALIVKKTALQKLQKPWFAGGTVSIVAVRAQDHFLEDGVAAFEDGTVNYVNIPAIKFGLELMESIGYELIKDRVLSLTGWLLSELSRLTHGNGQPLVRVYGPMSIERRGGTVSVNFYDANGQVVDLQAIERAAGELNISFRTGCFCNPGAAETALLGERGSDTLQQCFQQLRRESQVGGVRSPRSPISPGKRDYLHCLNSDHSGAVRISIGMVSNFHDVEAMLQFAKTFLLC